ncbi:MAG: hypothetical protein GXP42_05260 [Chloroflexi bacterium]|nr:hypothetical protein [Chloroflexota bacterium]
MNIRIRLFASLRDMFGASVLERELDNPATVADVLALLVSERGEPMPGNLHVAVNKEYANPDTPVHDGDEVAIFPTVSGGAEERKRFWLTTEPLSLDEVAARVTAADRGAIVLFSGAVRGITGDLQTDYLEYEAYEGMAEKTFAQIADEVRERWPQIEDIAIVHRVGRVDVCESSVIIAVAAGHRQGAFDACAYVIERIKQIAPIWKKEVGPDGDFWVEGPGEHVAG